MLSIWGIGPETADSILLYAYNKPYFVIDAYTRRVFIRIGILNGKECYEEIRKVCEGLGAEVLDRPEELANDEVHAAHVVVDVLKKIEGYDTVVLLQPTSPLRNAIHVNEALDVYEHGTFDSVISVGQYAHFIWVLGLQCPYPLNYDPFGRRPRRQDKLTDFVENGAIYIFKSTHFMDKKCVIYGRLGFYVMPEEANVEVDTPYTFFIAEQVLKNYDSDNR